jgi:tRNA(fMet)-specific endonuclease VapC
MTIRYLIDTDWVIDHLNYIDRLVKKERGRLRKQGALIGDFDLLIGATCLHYGLMLLTNNRQHFERVGGEV